MNTIQALFQQAQLAEAACANFSNSNVTVEAALVSSGFSFSQVADFVTHWKVVDHIPIAL